MIQAEGFHRGKCLILEVSFPGNRKEYRTIQGDTQEERIAAAWEYIYALNKNRISVQLTSWLRQRMFGLKEHAPKRSEQAFKLLVLMNYYNQFKYIKLCRVIADNKEIIESIAPKDPNSKAMPVYKNIIVPILKECEQIAKHIDIKK